MPKQKVGTVKGPEVVSSAGKALHGTTLHVAVGDRARPSLASAAHVTDIRWDIWPPKGIVGGHELKDATTETAPFTGQTSANPVWYWVEPGTYTVSASMRYRGCPWTREFKVVVVGATVTRLRAATDAVHVGTIVSPMGMDVTALTFGGLKATGTPGIVIEARAIGPRNGHFTMTQLIKPYRKTTGTGRFDGIEASLDYVVDAEPYYGVTTQPQGDVKTMVACNAGGSVTMFLEDSPARILPGNAADGARFEVGDSFETYLMYRPTNGIWTICGLLEWSWSGIATRVNGAWVLSGDAHTAVPQGRTSSGLVTYAKNSGQVLSQ